MTLPLASCKQSVQASLAAPAVQPDASSCRGHPQSYSIHGPKRSKKRHTSAGRRDSRLTECCHRAQGNILGRRCLGTSLLRLVCEVSTCFMRLVVAALLIRGHGCLFVRSHYGGRRTTSARLGTPRDSGSSHHLAAPGTPLVSQGAHPPELSHHATPGTGCRFLESLPPCFADFQGMQSACDVDGNPFQTMSFWNLENLSEGEVYYLEASLRRYPNENNMLRTYSKWTFLQDMEKSYILWRSHIPPPKVAQLGFLAGCCTLRLRARLRDQPSLTPKQH